MGLFIFLLSLALITFLVKELGTVMVTGEGAANASKLSLLSNVEVKTIKNASEYSWDKNCFFINETIKVEKIGSVFFPYAIKGIGAIHRWHPLHRMLNDGYYALIKKNLGL